MTGVRVLVCGSRNTRITDSPISDTLIDAACAAYLVEIEGIEQSDAVRVWREWRLRPALQGDALALETLEEERRAMRAALGVVLGGLRRG